MDDNPYAAPQSSDSAVGVLSGSREDLRAVARYQKVILICIAIYLLAVVSQFLLPETLRLFLGLGMLAVGLTGAVFTFMLAIKVYGTGIGILLGLLTLIPCIGLIALLAVNAKATNVLKQNGIPVGLLGADSSSI
ncbi:MAG: hypothetical protein R3C19_05555 [Planctomycetaceae bacterium]